MNENGEAAPTPSFLNDEQMDNLQKDIQQLCDVAGQKRREDEIKWLLARRFISGDQWLTATKDSSGRHSINEVSLPGRMQKWKITVNRLLPGLDTRLAHVLKNKPIGVVVPETQDEEDRNAARIGNEVVEYDFRATDYEGKMAERAGPEMFTSGNVYFHWCWDPLAGPDVEVVKYATDETGQPIVNPEFVTDPVTGEQTPHPMPGPVVAERKMLPRGEASLEVVEPEELYVDPSAKSLDDAEMVVHSTLKPVAKVKALLQLIGVDPEKIEDVARPASQAKEWGGSITNAARMSGLSQAEIAERAEVRVAWGKPNADKGWPDGIRAILVNRQIVYAEPTPAGSDHIPFAHLIERSLPGKFYGTSSVIQALPLQKALNLTVSRDEYRRTVQRPKMVADYEAGLEEGSVDNEDTSIIYKNAGYTVDWLNAPTYESDPRAVDRYISLIDDIFGNVAILMGESDGEVRSGRQAFIQGEYAGTALSGPARSIERAVKKIGAGLLKLRKANTDELRDIQIVGQNRSIEVIQFRGSDLEGAGDYYVEPGSALPMSMAQKKQMILELVDRAILDPISALKLLPMPSDLDAKMDEDRTDRDRAQEENMLFAALTEEQIAEADLSYQETEAQTAMASPMGAMAPPPDPAARLTAILEALNLEPHPEFEKNKVHWDEHRKFCVSKKYRMLPKAVKALIDHHRDMHLPPPAPTPDDGPGGGGKPGEAGAVPGAPSALVPGGQALVGNPEQGADMVGDTAHGLPPMPPTPSSSGELPV